MNDLDKIDVQAMIAAKRVDKLGAKIERMTISAGRSEAMIRDLQFVIKQRDNRLANLIAERDELASNFDEAHADVVELRDENERLSAALERERKQLARSEAAKDAWRQRYAEVCRKGNGTTEKVVVLQEQIKKLEAGNGALVQRLLELVQQVDHLDRRCMELAVEAAQLQDEKTQYEEEAGEAKLLLKEADDILHEGYDRAIVRDAHRKIAMFIRGWF